MLKGKDGLFLFTPEVVADRWEEFFSDELGGVPTTFRSLQAMIETRKQGTPEVSLALPSLDELLDVIWACSRGKALGPDAIPVELILAGGLPAGKLVHGLICACWLQSELPLSWKGGRLFHIPKP